MSGCSYCGRSGCGYETCPEHLEEKWGVASDYDDDGELKTDGGTSANGADLWVLFTVSTLSLPARLKRV